MNNFIKSCLFAFLSMLTLTVVAQNRTISIQSTFKDISGKPIPDGDQEVTFRLYKEDGSPMWDETTMVDVQSGVFSHLLGSANPFNDLGIFSNKLFLGIKPLGQPELVPRTELTYAPYAMAVNSIAGLDKSASFENIGGHPALKVTSTLTPKDIRSSANNYGDNDTGINFPDDGEMDLICNGIPVMKTFHNTQNFGVHFPQHVGFGPDANNSSLLIGIGDNNTGISHPAEDDLRIVTNGADRITIKPDGKVGIGTSSPNISLAIGDHDTGIKHLADGALAFQTNGTERLRIFDNGRIKIGGDSGNNGAVAPLEVDIEGNTTNSSYRSVVNNTADWKQMWHGTPGCNAFGFIETKCGASGGNFGNVAIGVKGDVVVNGSVVSATGISWSDKRIKNILGISNAKNDLDLIKKIEITDYEHIDKVFNDRRVIKKVIAQQVESLLPNVVSSTRRVIPSVYENATRVDFEKGILTISTNKKHEFIAGDMVELKCFEGRNYREIEVIEVKDEYTFTVKAETDPKEVFVYGKYVDDFRAVDYDAIAMLNVSATQELIRKVEALEAANALLNKSNDSLLKENKMLKDATSSIEARLQKLESLSVKSEASNSVSAVVK
ncbi:MAG: tail fiber domain-containing protein [Saprospiraceae bacterium]|nr:tail fiber domain-containing protein [Saprospiraceae bacterium]